MKKRLFDKELEEEIIKLYKSGLSSTKIGIKFGTSKNNILRLLKRNNIKRRSLSECHRTFKINESYLDKIDTEEKAYILGFFYADGAVVDTTISIVASEIDKDIIEKIRKAFEYEGMAKYNNPKTNTKPYYRLGMTNKKLANNLIKYGCMQSKSLKLIFPSKKILPSHLLHHFIRGYFDGDGSFYYNKRTACISICSTENFLKTIKSICKKRIKINCSIYSPKNCLLRGNNITKVLRFGGKNQVLSFLNWIYKDSSIFLDRKNKIYTQFLKEREKKRLTNEQKWI